MLNSMGFNIFFLNYESAEKKISYYFSDHQFLSRENLL